MRKEGNPDGIPVPEVICVNDEFGNPLSPQVKNALSANPVFVLAALVFAIEPRPMTTSLVEFTLEDCFCSKPDASSLPMPAMLVLKAAFAEASQTTDASEAK